MLDKHRSDDPRFWRGARRLLVKISVVSGIIPTSLTIQGVTLLEKEAVFGGGFADIYKASYKNSEVALKRMRIFQRGKERHEIHRVRAFDAFGTDLYLTAFPIDILQRSSPLAVLSTSTRASISWCGL